MKQVLQFLFAVSVLLLIPQSTSAVSYGSGYYTNLCGTGTAATADTCNKGCSTSSGSCSSSTPYVVKWTCDGNYIECRGGETDFTTSQSLSGAACGKTVQIDVFKRKCRTSLGWVCNPDDLLDYMVWYSGDCAQAAPTATPTPTGQTQVSSCDELRVVSGNNSLVPVTVTLRARGSDNLGSIQSYRFFFGDGKQEESASAEITHRYESSGTFSARADVRDSRGNWKTSSSCETTVTVNPLSVESQKSDCSDLFIPEGNYSQAPANVRFRVTGFDNKGAIKKYKVDFGNGQSEEREGNTFEKRYETAGTYTARGFILDTQNNWKGGSGSCERTVYVNTTPLTSQPATGTPTTYTLMSLVSGAIGVTLLSLSIKAKHA